MLKCIINEGTSYRKESVKDVGPMYVDLKIKPGQEFAAQVAISLAAAQFAAGASHVSPRKLSQQVNDTLAAICEINVADGTAHVNAETNQAPGSGRGR